MIPVPLPQATIDPDSQRPRFPIPPGDPRHAEVCEVCPPPPTRRTPECESNPAHTLSVARVTVGNGHPIHLCRPCVDNVVRTWAHDSAEGIAVAMLLEQPA